MKLWRKRKRRKPTEEEAYAAGILWIWLIYQLVKPPERENDE